MNSLIITVKLWVAEYKRDRSNIFDNERSGRPKAVTTEEVLSLVHTTAMENP